MTHRAAITVNRPRDEVERRWRELSPEVNGSVTFAAAPGGRGTEIHLELEGGGLREKLGSSATRAKAKDEMRRFKQRVETGVLPRSEHAPEGERFERKLKRRAAQPLADDELEKAGA